MTTHNSVLLNEAVEALDIKPDGLYVDCTFGRGGHSKQILKALGENGRLLAIDKDKAAVEFAREHINDKRFKIFHAGFSQLDQILQKQKADGILLDLGVSSPQLDDVTRGFSFLSDGPLDMRMNREQQLDAAKWLNQAGEREIADVLYRYGEEKKSRRIAKQIVKTRKDKPLTRTSDLVDCVKRVSPAHLKKHPATRTFQAIRIFINDELVELKEFLARVIDLLKIGARLVVISFHSLEDRLVKQAFKAKKQRLPKEIPLQPIIDQRLRQMMKIKPSASELADNLRARSAIMRVATRIA